jgi:hypothetical protein
LGENANTVNQLQREITTESAIKRKEEGGARTKIKAVDTIEVGSDEK